MAVVLPPLDWIALATFIAAWLGYHVVIESGLIGPGTLNARMNDHRRRWMRNMMVRENRIVDTTIMASLQNGTAFFASTSLLAVGASLTLLRSPDEVVRVFADLSLGASTDRVSWELKTLGLTVIFGYAFFKFSWSYRLFNYAAILIGATPSTRDPDDSVARTAADRAADMNIVAAQHFNRGQRAFFFALAYLGWFVGPVVLIVTTLASLIVMYRRQHGSDAIAALGFDQDIT